VRDAGYHDILDGIGLTAERVDELMARLSTVMAEPHGSADVESVLSELVPEAGDPARLWSALRAVGAFRNAPTTDPPLCAAGFSPETDDSEANGSEFDRQTLTSEWFGVRGQLGKVGAEV
jgi:hypothetical protein